MVRWFNPFAGIEGSIMGHVRNGIATDHTASQSCNTVIASYSWRAVSRVCNQFENSAKWRRSGTVEDSKSGLKQPGPTVSAKA